MRCVHSALIWLVAAPLTGFMSLLAVVVSLFPGQRGTALACVRAWARGCLWIAGCRLRIAGEGRLPALGPVVFMANHQSALDIPVLLAVVPAHLHLTVWAKKSLFRIPFLGWAMRAIGLIPVDRVNRLSAVAMFSDSLRQLRCGRSLLVFPEETYGPGDALLPFQRGGFLAAVKATAPVVPVGVHGTSWAFPPGSRSVRPQKLTVRIGAPIPTTDLSVGELATLMERTRRAIADLSRDSAPT